MTQSCRAKRRRWSGLRHSAITAWSADVRLQCRASSSSLGSIGSTIRRAFDVTAEASSIDIEVRTLQVGREIVTRWSRVDGRRVEGTMAELSGEFDQLAGIISQIAEREAVAPRVHRNRPPLQRGSPAEAGDN